MPLHPRLRRSATLANLEFHLSMCARCVQVADLVDPDMNSYRQCLENFQNWKDDAAKEAAQAAAAAAAAASAASAAAASPAS